MKAAYSSYPECGDGSLGDKFRITHTVMEVNNLPFSYQAFGAIGGNPEFMRIMAPPGVYMFRLIAETSDFG